MKAVIYARFSSEKQNEASIEGQLRECMEFANFNSIEVIGNYIDRAQSAKTDHRPEFQRMIKDSYKHAFDCILVWKLDRFARNRYDSAYYKNVLKKNGVRVISAKETISQGAEGILLESLLEGYAEFYSAELSEKVKRGMTENALKAKSNGVRPPFGYYVDDTDHYQIDETLAPVVREIYTRYLDGMRVNDIVKLLNERGIRHKGFEMKYNAVFRILTNRKYIGEYKFGDIVLPNAMPAIIDEETFNAVQERMARNKKAPAMHRSEDDYLLTTRLFCGKCGAMMTGVIGTSHTARQYRYYKCNHAKQSKCDKKSVRKEWLEELVLDEIKELLASDEVIEELADRVYELQLQEDSAESSIQAQLTGVETKLNNLVEAIAQGIYSSATKKALDELEERKRNLEIELFEAQTRNPVLTKEQILFALHNFRKIDISTQEGKQRLIDGFVNSIYLYDDHFVITYNYKGRSKTVSFEEVNSSPFTSKGSPNKLSRLGSAQFYFGGLYVGTDPSVRPIAKQWHEGGHGTKKRRRAFARSIPVRVTKKQGFFARKTPVFLLLNALLAFFPPNHSQKIKGSKEPFYNVIVTRSNSGSVDPGLGVIDISPSTCSSKLGLTDCHIGSKIKSIPSLRACFAAGTKSLSPAINTILSTCLLYAIL